MAAKDKRLERQKHITPQDREVWEVLKFIQERLGELKDEAWGSFREKSKEWGVLSKSLSDFLYYTQDSDPSFRVTYKILRGILGRPPIDISKPKDIKDEIRKAKDIDGDFSNKLLEVIQNRESIPKRYLENIKWAVDLAHQRLLEQRSRLKVKEVKPIRKSQDIDKD